MNGVALVRSGLSAAASTVATVELGLAAVAVALLLALLAVRAKRDRDQKIRKAGSVGYHDRDAARYLQATTAPGPAGAFVDPAHVPLAPTFMAPGRSRPARRGTPRADRPRPMPSSFGPPPGAPPQPVPAFDPAEAVRARPVTAPVPASSKAAPSPPPPPPPPPPGLPTFAGWNRPPPPGAASADR